MSNDDVATQLQQLGFRVSLPALRAFFEHTTKSRIGPVEVCEKLVEMERRERESRNLLARTRLATLGKFATLGRFASLAVLLTDRLRRESLPALERCLRHRYLSPNRLICDEPGYLPCDNRS